MPTNYGTTTTGLGGNEVLGTCDTGDPQDDQEDWGVAIAVVAGERSWRNGALRIVIPVADAGPYCGGTTANSGDAAVIANAVSILQNERVIPIPIVDHSGVSANAADDLVAGVGLGQVLHFDEDAIAARIAAYIIRHCPTDCNQNDVLDECDIANSTSCDEDDDGLPDECYACCTEGDCINRPSEFCDSGSSQFYHGMTCAECTCHDFAPCCLNGICCSIPACACRAAGGVPVVGGTGVSCSPTLCTGELVTGACCFGGGCEDNALEEHCQEDAFWYPRASCDAFPFVCDRVDECPLAEIDTTASTNPPNNVVDARYPHPPNNSTSRRGIGYEGTGAVTEDEIKIKLVNNSKAVTGATAAECWCLCETAEDASLGRNSISCVEELGNGFYRIHVERPITTHQITTISYKTSSNFMTYISHPANVNGDGSAVPNDIIALINYLNGVGTVPWGKWSCDIDRSGLCAPADILAEIDMLNGVNGFTTWNATSKPTSTDCPSLSGVNYCDFGRSCGESFASMSSGSEPGPNVCEVDCFSAYIVEFLTGYDEGVSILEGDLMIVVQGFYEWSSESFDSKDRKALADSLASSSYASTSGYEAATSLVDWLGQ